MPHVPDLASFPFESQEKGTLYCVPCCLSMICQYWNLDREWHDLVGDLQASAIDGTPFDNLQWVEGFNPLAVNHLDEIWNYLIWQPAVPVIANIWIDDASVCSYFKGCSFSHAVVIVGIDEDEVTFFDPLTMEEQGHSEAVRRRLQDFHRAWQGGWALIPQSG